MTEVSQQEKAKRLSQEGITLAREGHRKVAIDRFRRAVALDAANELAWLHLAGLANTAAEARYALQRVELLSPANPHLEQARLWVCKIWPMSEQLATESPPNRKDGTNSADQMQPPRQSQRFQEASPSSSEDANTIIQSRDNRPNSAKKPPLLNPNQTEAISKTSPPTANTKRLTTIIWSLAGVALILLATLSALLATTGGVRDAVDDLVAVIFPTPTNTLMQELALLQEAVDLAQARSDQQAMIENLEKMYALAPYNEEITNRLAELYYERGLILRNGGSFEEAQIAFNQALAIQETMETAQLERRQVNLYLTGITHHQQGRWREAIAAFEEIYAQTPQYPFLSEMLYSAYFNQGMALEANRDLTAALEAFERAAEVLPAMPDAPRRVAEVNLLLNPPTPTPAPTATPRPSPTPNPAQEKVVIVDISEQHSYLYQGETLVYDFVISTGEPGRDTAIGEFEILNKIPVAYASTWNLDMPFWLGIYWSGPLQNGFHALPTVRHTGQTMWDGYLGQRVSYGCVILSMEDAETLYNWVDIGTPVKIQW